MNSYKDLKVYEKSYNPAKELYVEARSFPRDELYGMTSQIKRASTSIPLNIAEGYGKGSVGKELLRFLMMARGSCSEMEVLLDFSKDFEFIEKEKSEQYKERYAEVGRMLTGLIKSVTTNL